MSMRSPLSRVRGLGSAKEGLTHWLHQRITAVALVPLTIWLLASMIALGGADYVAFKEWLAVPCNTSLMILLLILVFHHAQLGLQVVIEDYVHGALKVVGIVGVKLLALLLGVFSVVAVLRTAFVGG